MLDEEPENTKALFRRGQAYLGLHDIDNAAKDLQEIENLKEQSARVLDTVETGDNEAVGNINNNSNSST